MRHVSRALDFRSSAETGFRVQEPATSAVCALRGEVGEKPMSRKGVGFQMRLHAARLRSREVQSARNDKR